MALFSSLLIPQSISKLLDWPGLGGLSRLPEAVLKSLSPNPQLDLAPQLLLEIYRGTGSYWLKGESARVC